MTEPWSRAAALRCLAVAITGAAVSAAGWYSAAGHPGARQQAAPASLTAVGLMVAFAAGASWVHAGRRAVAVRRRRLLGDGASHPMTQPARGTSTSLVGGKGLRFFHRADCVIAVGQPWPTRSRAAHVRAGRAPCGICRP